MTGMAPGWLKRRLTEPEKAVYVAWERWDALPGESHTARARVIAVQQLAYARGVNRLDLHQFFAHLRREGMSILEAIVHEDGFG